MRVVTAIAAIGLANRTSALDCEAASKSAFQGCQRVTASYVKLILPDLSAPQSAKKLKHVAARQSLINQNKVIKTIFEGFFHAPDVPPLRHFAGASEYENRPGGPNQLIFSLVKKERDTFQRPTLFNVGLVAEWQG